MSGNTSQSMFSALESTWDQSTRRGWTTLASFTMQACGISLLLAISLIWAAGPPQVRWLQISAPASFAPQPEVVAQTPRGHQAAAGVSVPRPAQMIAPPWIPLHTKADNSDAGPLAPDLPHGAIGSGGGSDIDTGIAVPGGLGNMPVVIPPRPAPVRPLLVSHLAEANLLVKVQPIYPALARQVRVQGAVELRAIISKRGTIENLVVVRGHPMLSAAAIEAVRQWRYRPYLLNNEPTEVETDITVNFVLSGG